MTFKEANSRKYEEGDLYLGYLALHSHPYSKVYLWERTDIKCDIKKKFVVMYHTKIRLDNS